jgi:hypothetical protein
VEGLDDNVVTVKLDPSCDEACLFLVDEPPRSCCLFGKIYDCDEADESGYAGDEALNLEWISYHGTV